MANAAMTQADMLHHEGLRSLLRWFESVNG